MKKIAKLEKLSLNVERLRRLKLNDNELQHVNGGWQTDPDQGGNTRSCSLSPTCR